MDSTQLAWLIVGIAVVIVIIIIVAVVARRRSAQHKQQMHERAEKIRAEAAQHELDVREREAKAKEAQARAERAEVEAARLRQQADETQGATREERERIAERRQHADKLDPNVPDRSGRQDRDASRRDDTDHQAVHDRSTEARGDGRHVQDDVRTAQDGHPVADGAHRDDANRVPDRDRRDAPGATRETDRDTTAERPDRRTP
ncbi:hypothetical protein [Sinomonas flava]|uniref:hypothetical protein n=1 Tax=Sinomonas flava TaxID=496857 RepID=UPI0039A6C32A